MTELIKTNGPNSILPVSYYDFLKILESKPLRNDCIFIGDQTLDGLNRNSGRPLTNSLLLTPGEYQVSTSGTLPSHFRAQKHLL